MENIDLEEGTENYTHEELKALVDKQWSRMSDEEKAWRCGYRNGVLDPTFHEYVLYHTKAGDKIELNEYTKEFKIIR